jgi:hypothetical protein
VLNDVRFMLQLPKKSSQFEAATFARLGIAHDERMPPEGMERNLLVSE